MAWALICIDKPGALALRKENREDHLAYAKSAGRIALAGPFLSDAGKMAGSLIILDVETRAEAEAWAAGDPYARAGLFEDVKILRWTQTI